MKCRRVTIKKKRRKKGENYYLYKINKRFTENWDVAYGNSQFQALKFHYLPVEQHHKSKEK